MSRAIAYCSPFVPAEWIAAHGFRPLRIIPDGAPTPATEGACPFAKAFICAATEPGTADAIVMTSTCDQMRRAAEFTGRRTNVPVFLLGVPVTCGTSTAQRMYHNELGRLGRFLVTLGGAPPSHETLITQMIRYDAARSALRQSRPFICAKAFAQAIEQLGESPSGPTPSQQSSNGIPIAIVGGPVSHGDRFIYDLIEHAGGRVLLDATETGTRTLPEAFDRRRLNDDPLLELADTYFRIPDVFRRPNDGLYQYLRDNLADKVIRGVILVRCLWCDLWHAEFPRLREWLNLPSIDIDLTGDTGEAPRIRTRIESLLESLR
jgi:benzoyl-CoA reductase/2-hydroxyglutaryl-CoA dehydratase subunit BcrC/BadD/HgdB